MEEGYSWLAGPRLVPGVPVSHLGLLTLSPSSCFIRIFSRFSASPPRVPIP